MNAMINFNFETVDVRVVMLGDDPWWVAADISEVLGYRMAADMTRNLDDDEKGTHNLRTPGGEQEMTIISESGLFAAILKSRRAEAKRFRRWVTGEVLPSIRKTGRYEMFDDPPTLPSPAVQDAELPRLTAAIGIMREARQIWGREECRSIWIKIGLPTPIAEASMEADGLTGRVGMLIRGREMIQLGELVAALGMEPSARASLRLGVALRANGWSPGKQRIKGVPTNVWMPIAGWSA